MSKATKLALFAVLVIVLLPIVFRVLHTIATLVLAVVVIGVGYKLLVSTKK